VEGFNVPDGVGESGFSARKSLSVGLDCIAGAGVDEGPAGEVPNWPCFFCSSFFLIAAARSWTVFCGVVGSASVGSHSLKCKISHSLEVKISHSLVETSHSHEVKISHSHEVKIHML
jgi:hypothetical protein